MLKKSNIPTKRLTEYLFYAILLIVTIDKKFQTFKQYFCNGQLLVVLALSLWIIRSSIK